MKFKSTSRKTVLLALAGAALSTLTGVAAVVPVNSGDVFVGFRATTGQGSTVSYLVNLGNFSQLRDTPAGTTIDFGTFGTDLEAAYGSDWYTSGNVVWSVFGTTSTSANLASRARTDDAVKTVAWSAGDAGQQSGVNGGITNVISSTYGANNTGGFGSINASVNAANAVFQTNSNLATSYKRAVADLGTEFYDNSPWSNIEGRTDSILDIHRITAQGVYDTRTAGSFNLSEDGTLNYSIIAIPEASTSLLTLAGVSVAVIRRRRPVHA